MLTQTATNAFKVGLATGSFNFNADTFKMALYTANATLDAMTATYTTNNEVVGAGYTAGGQVLTVSTAPTVGVSGTIMYLSFANVTWSPASFTARGALIYDASNGNQTVCVLDFGSDKTAVNSFTVQFPTPSNTTAIIRIA